MSLSGNNSPGWRGLCPSGRLGTQPLSSVLLLQSPLRIVHRGVAVRPPPGSRAALGRPRLEGAHLAPRSAENVGHTSLDRGGWPEPGPRLSPQ